MTTIVDMPPRCSNKIAIDILALAAAAATAGTHAQSQPPKVVLYASSFVSQQAEVPAEGYSIYPDKLPAYRGYIAVPENRDDPQSRKITLGFWLLKSTATQKRAPVLYMNGGPGHAFVEEVATRSDYFPLIRRELAFADVILLDQRGAGAPSISLPSLQCPEKFAFRLDEPWTARSRLVTMFGDRIARCAKYFDDSGADLRGYTSVQSADDVDDLRRALGYAKLNVWGESYGAYLAEIFLSRHPGSVERAIIGQGTGNAPQIRGGNAARPLFDMLASGFTTGSGQVFPPDPTLERDTRAALRRLEERPLVATATRPDTGETVPMTLGKYDLQFAIMWGLHEPADQWLEVKDGIRGVLRGDGRWLARRMIAWRLGLHRSNVEGKLMGYLMECNSTPQNESYDSVPAFDQDMFEGETINGPFPEVCRHLRQYVSRPPASREYRGEVLFWAGGADATVPLSETRKMTTKYPNSRLLILDGYTHSGGGPKQEERLTDARLQFLSGAPLTRGEEHIPPD